ncbi:copper amine oxidase N-terminal domain-containing protein [Paenibacillus tuaregi]|uniref:copper amine oxidase N-terminal domain-containing protein n=1 Tax=Paenibacillus tuaregi TaxID=1816681 RepID=UPI000837E665|nr:copper amine oxidase N-terminal domain-containing protein [Paenibacillus tuaregi]
MKKWMPTIITAALLAGVVSTGSTIQAKAALSSREQVYINGAFQEDARIQNGRALVPLRSLNDSDELTYNYDAKTHEVTVRSKDGGKVIKLKAGSKTALVNGKSVKLNQSIVNHKGRTYVPLRFVSEALGGIAYYNAKDNRAIVRTPAGQAEYETLMKGDLTAARNVAINLQRAYDPGLWYPQGYGYYTYIVFPEGQALQFSRKHRSLTDYLKVNRDGLLEVVYEENDIGGTKPKTRGIKPKREGSFVYFYYDLMGGGLDYGKGKFNSEETKLGFIEDSNDPGNKYPRAVPVEGEVRTD